MTTATVRDYRRSDLRTALGGDPYWVSSKVVDGFEISGLKDKACALFSFPVAGQQVIIREVVVQVLKAFTANTTLELGIYTADDDDFTTGDLVTLVDSDAYMEAGDVLPGTAGWYYPTVGSFVDARGSGATIDKGNLIIGASTAVPLVALTPKVATVAVGQVRVLLLLEVVPGS